MAQQFLDLSPGGDKVGEANEKVQANFSELYQTTGSLSTVVQSLTALAPDQLNTFAELAAAIGNDPNYATTARRAARKAALIFG